MAKGKREFELKINGVEGITTSVITLAEVLQSIEKQIAVNNKCSEETSLRQAQQEKQEAKLAETIDRVVVARTEASRAQVDATIAAEAAEKQVRLEQEAYNAATNSLEEMEAQLKLLQDQRSRMDVGTEDFNELSDTIAILSLRIEKTKEAKTELEKTFASLGENIGQTINLGNGLNSMFKMGGQVLNLFGVESDMITKSMARMQEIIGLLSTAQEINNSLLKLATFLKGKDAAVEKSRAAQTVISTTATNASSVAMKLFSKALVATGIGAFVVLLGALIANFDNIKKVILDTFPALGEMGAEFDKIKAVVMGVGNALLEFVVTPFKILIATVKGFMEDGIDGAIKAGKEATKNGIDAINKLYEEGYTKQVLKNAKETNKQLIAQSADLLENIIKDNESKMGSDYKYTESGKKMYASLYAAKKTLYADDAEAMQELRREEWKHLADIEKHTKNEQKARQQTFDDYRKSLKSFHGETYQMELANQQKEISLAKSTAEKMKVTTEEELKVRNEKIKESYDKQNILNSHFAELEKEALEERYKELIKKAKNAGQKTTELEAEKEKQLNELQKSAAIQEAALRKEQEDKIETSTKAFNKAMLEEQKKSSDLKIKEVDNEYRAIEDIQKKFEKEAKKRKEDGKLIDVDATREHLEKVKVALTDYVNNAEAAKEKLIATRDANLANLIKGTTVYQEEMNKYADAEYALNQKIEKANEEKEKITKESNDLVFKSWQEMFENISEKAKMAMEGIKAIFDAVGSIQKAQLEELNEKLEEVSERYDEVEKKREESTERIKNFEQQIQEAQGGSAIALREQLQREMQAKAELDQEEKRLAKEKEKREAEVAKKEKQMKKAEMVHNIAQGISNIAAGIAKALALGPIFGPPMAAIVGAMGAVQVGVMTKQLSKLEKGGLLNGPSHANGGMRVQGTNIEVEGGEYVVNKRSTALNQPLIEYINNADRPVTARDLMNLQGIPVNNYSSRSTPNVQVRDTYTTEDKILEAIEGINFRPVVSVKDINTVQANIVDVTDIAGID